MLETKEGSLYLDGKPLRIISGSIHYFRIVEGYWRDRLEKLKAGGFNTVETYIPWNFHEPKKGRFILEGMHNVERFIQLAEEMGLYVILRPSPYICAEWEMGGLPAWLLKDPDLRFRCSDPVFLAHLKEYYDHLLPVLKTYQYSEGGPVIAFQIENEYGAYGDDKTYLEAIRRMYHEHGIRELLFTSDGPDMSKPGSLRDEWTTLNFGSRPEEAFQELEKWKPGEPRMCMEYWIGWFDAWGHPHHTRDAASTGDVLKRMLNMGASMNVYMFHGGTNFQFYNGANHYDTYEPTITSYDYDALLTESGEITEKFRTVQRILAEEGQDVEMIPEEKPARLSERKVELSQSVSLFDTLSTVSARRKNVTPLTMEELDQSYGFVLYRTTFEGKGMFSVELDAMQDRAFLYINGVYQYTYYRNDTKKVVDLFFPEESNTFEIFIENMGRVNYGKYLSERKGLIQNVWIGNRYTFDWEMYSIELEEPVLDFHHQTDERFPKFFEGSFSVETPADTFVQLDGWKKGNVLINGFNLGRYWEIGPQKTLYLPAPLLQEGENKIQVLELEGHSTPSLSLVPEPDLG
ncbi:glycoside hydrolase family 35 protein [Salibacterium qingdaonense]|uniref:Beta-galactosidase n=1 Tax=Salibacterium qingdaonense TaxID=266892 RepID=A0A1I4NTK6_9BACI|nr:beta-galactosidase family protein [Salibacterium qingdaonense]SFM18735.1 beta-galactosidase [Salibacterium qingdaonense]